MEWRNSHDPEEVSQQIQELEQIQAEIRADDSIISELASHKNELCPMCEQLLDGISDETDEEELDTRITLQVAYLEDQLDRWLSTQF